MRVYIFSLLFLLLAFNASAQRKTIITIQYAGSIGYMSVGGGITSRTQKVQHEILYGFVPKAYGGPLDKITYKLTYLPFKLKIGRSMEWLPVNPTVFASYNIGKDYSLQPSYKKYDQDYYWWSPALRFHAGINTAVKLTNENCRNKAIIYLEANTNDRYITSWWDNTSVLNVSDIFFLGAGIKVMLE